MATPDLTEILILHNHMQRLDKSIQSMPLHADGHDSMSREYDATMQRLVQLMGQATKRKLC